MMETLRYIKLTGFNGKLILLNASKADYIAEEHTPPHPPSTTIVFGDRAIFVTESVDEVCDMLFGGQND